MICKWMLAGMIAVACRAQNPAIQERGIVREGNTMPQLSTREELNVPHGYALVIGIANYLHLDKRDNLQFPERDAESIYDVLISKEGGNLPAENVRKLTGSKATLANMRDALEKWLPATARAGDNVVVYFAGHGDIRNGRGYLLPYDADPDRLEQTAYPMDTLGKVFSENIKSTWKVLLTDACHSGAITPEVTEQVNQRLSNVDPQVFSFTASRKRESSFESAEIGGGHGVFTYFVAQGLQGQADMNHDGVVTADELVDYVRSQVTKYTSDRGQRQTPSENQDFDHRLVLAYNPKISDMGNAATTKGDLFVEVNLEGVELLVNGESKGVFGKSNPLKLFGLAPGTYTVQGNKMGYAPDGPRPIVVQPGRQTTVPIRIQFTRKVKESAKAEFDKGLKLYEKGSEKELRQAIPYFQDAFAEDSKYSKAAMYLGRTYQILFETDTAIGYLKRAIAIDADYADAHLSYGSALMDNGEINGAVTEFRYVTNRDPRSGLAWTHLAQAYRMAGSYDNSTEAARQAIQLNSSNAQAYLWMGDSLRALRQFEAARQAYSQYLRLTDFEAKAYERVGSFLTSKLLAYDFVGVRRATEKLIFYDLRNLAYFGLCACEQRAGNFNVAAEDCRKALRYDPQDAFSYYQLGSIYLERYNALRDTHQGSLQDSEKKMLADARGYFQKMIAINGDLEEAGRARAYVGKIDTLLR